MRSAAVEMFADNLEHQFRITESAGIPVAVERPQAFLHRLERTGRKYAVFLKHSFAGLETVGRGRAVCRQSRKRGQFRGILRFVNVDIHILAACDLKSIRHFETMAHSNGQSGYELIYVGRTVGGTDLKSLLLT